MNFRNCLLSTILVLFVSVSCFAQDAVFQAKNSGEKMFYTNTIEREGYQVLLKQYSKEYPMALYVIYKEFTPLVSEIQKTLKKELLTISKTVSKDVVIIASAWFDDQISEEIEKIELSTRNSAFVWVGGEEKTIKSFPDYIKYLKEKLPKDKEQEQANNKPSK